MFNPKKLKDTRIDKDMLQKEMAIALNKSCATISAYESGETLPPIDVIFQIAKILNISVEYLLDLNIEEKNIYEHQNKYINSLNKICDKLPDEEIIEIINYAKYRKNQYLAQNKNNPVSKSS